MRKPRRLRTWWLHMSAVPVADGLTRFHLGTSSDVPAAVARLREAGQKVRCVWSIKAGTERAAHAARRQMAAVLGMEPLQLQVDMRTDQQSDKLLMKQAMESVRAMLDDGTGGQWCCAISLRPHATR